MSDTMDPRTYVSFDEASPDKLTYLSRTANEMLKAGQITAEERVGIGLEIARGYSNTAAKSRVLEELVSLTHVCRGNDKLLLKIAECALDLEEFGLASDVLKDDPTFSIRVPVVRLHLAQCELSKNDVIPEEVLRPLFSDNVQDVAYWKRLALICEHHLGPKMALRAVQTAMQHSARPFPPDLVFQYGLRLFQCGRWRNAKTEFKKLAGGYDATGHLGESLVRFSLDMGDRRLAIRFLQDWIGANSSAETSIEDMIKACDLLLAVKDLRQARERLNALLSKVEKGLVPSSAQYAQLIELSQTIDFDLERRTITLAHAHYPENIDFQILFNSHRDAFARSLENSVKTIDAETTSSLFNRSFLTLSVFSKWIFRR